MKRIISAIEVVFFLVSCSMGDFGMNLFKDNNTIADETFDQVISAINSKDISKLKNIFSNTVQDEKDTLEEEFLEFVDFVQGDIISYSSASEAGVGADTKAENGKVQKELQSAFSVNTTESEYYVAIKECVRDDFDSNNVGVLSVYIIESKNWDSGNIYRGDGQWTRGINIVE